MVKRALFKISGDLDQGVRVELTIGEIGSEPFFWQSATLKPSPELKACSKRHWDENYRGLVTERARSLPMPKSPPPTPDRRRNNGESMRAPRPTAIRKVRQALKEWKERCDRSEEELRQWFRAWIDESPSFRELISAARDELPKDEAFQFVIQHDDPEVRRLPWQEWSLFEDRKKAEPSFSNLTGSQRSIVSPSNRDRVRILVILGNCENIDTKTDRQLFQEIEQETGAEIVFLDGPNRPQVNNQLWDQGWDLIFFAGHSTSHDGEAKILLNADGDYLTIDDLWHGLRRALDHGLKLAIFNSCDGLGLAKRLDDRQIPFTIVMREAITDGVAQEFLRCFLKEFISKGLSLQESVREAREKLHTFRDRLPCPSWLPVIVQQPYAGMLYWSDLVQSAEPVVIEPGTPPIEPEPSTPVMPRSTTAATSPDSTSESTPESPPESSSTWPMGKNAILRYSATIVAVCVVLPLVCRSGSDWLVDRGIEQQQVVGSKRVVAMKRAERLFAWAIWLNRWNGEAWMFRGGMYEDSGDPENDERARLYYTRAKNLGDGVGCSNLGRLQLIVDRDFAATRRTLTYCDYLIQNDQVSSKSAQLKNWGWLLYEKGDYTGAEEYFEESLQIQPDNGKSSCLLAKTLQQLDRQTEARSHWSDCLQNASDYYPEVQQWHREAELALLETPTNLRKCLKRCSGKLKLSVERT